MLIPLASIPLLVLEDFKKLNTKEYNFLCNLKEKKTGGGGENFITINKQILELEELSNLKQNFLEVLLHYSFDILKIKNTFLITDSWATRNPPGTFHAEHVHDNSIFSGIFYVDVEGGELELIVDPLYSKNFKFTYEIESYNILNSKSWKLGLKPNMLVIFPSWVSHRVTINDSKTDRRIIGFNTFTLGAFGSDLTVDNLKINLK